MALTPFKKLQGRLRQWMQPKPKLPAEWQQARDIVAAVDAGGMPLNPARVNAVARALGLEVSPRARSEETIERLRAALARAGIR